MALKKSDLYSSLWASCDELRGGMDASQYKDYVLFMLFIKYVSDKYGDCDEFAPSVVIPKGASFKDMVALTGKDDIGDKINTQVIQPLIDANARLARSDFPDFNDSNKLGDGAQKVEKLGNLIAIFNDPALDFSKNRAENDDKQAALRDFVAGQPTGYCDALDVRRPDWDRLLDNLARRYGSHAQNNAGHPLLWRPSLGYDWSAQFPVRPRIDWRHCPIHLVDDSSRLGIPPGWLSCFARLSAIVETAEFRRKLEGLDSLNQRAWARTKQKLGVAITAGVDFKKWERGGNGLYSVRVNDNFRAHLLHRKSSDDWLALDIGKHKEMGHG